jgi:hypothetical protein
MNLALLSDLLNNEAQNSHLYFTAPHVDRSWRFLLPEFVNPIPQNLQYTFLCSDDTNVWGSCDLENETNSVAKYGNPVCIDLSESDPDLFHVQSEIEARVNLELNNLDMNYKSFDGNVDGIYGSNETECLSFSA